MKDRHEEESSNEDTGDDDLGDDERSFLAKAVAMKIDRSQP